MRKKFFVLVLLFISSIVLGQQNVSEINAVLKIPDSLIHSHEIRVYKRYQISNGTEIFRFFEENKEWKTEFYHYYHPIGKNDKPEFEKEKLKDDLSKEFAWMRIVLSNVEFLPKEESFSYKLKTRKILIEGGECLFSITSSAISDGVSYKVFFKTGTRTNDFEYGNPESKLIKYPGVDELEMFSQLLIAIREEFGIWKD